MVMMIMLLIFSLVVAILTGVPYIKKTVEDGKKLKEFEENGMGKNEAKGKLRDGKTSTDKVICYLFYFSFVVFVISGVYNIYSLTQNNNMMTDNNTQTQLQPTNSMPEVSTGPNGQTVQNQNGNSSSDTQNTPATSKNLNNSSENGNDEAIQNNVRREQNRINKMFEESERNTKDLLSAFTRNVQNKDAEEGIKNGEKALKNVKKSNEMFKNAQCVQTGDANFDKECPKLLEQGKELYSSKQVTVEKALEMLKSIEKGIKEVQSSQIGQDVMKKGEEIWDSIMKNVNGNNQ
ncbi:hypothetical protein [Leptotrichia sp. oral taxon 218]|uniref:hypothetical protein n=1 Tax=Leptotrichia sp. oral taxon 218 TaxID=712361 RepID=UPI002011D127|nr:hypothetical protein [Leptotrichia sp. oral taxon 218]